MAINKPGFQPVQEFYPNSVEHRRHLARAINSQLQGNVNVTRDVTLEPMATETVVRDARIGVFRAILFCPLSASAAAALPDLYVSALENGQATLTHASAAATDQNFRLVILG